MVTLHKKENHLKKPADLASVQIEAGFYSMCGAEPDVRKRHFAVNRVILVKAQLYAFVSENCSVKTTGRKSPLDPDLSIRHMQ